MESEAKGMEIIKVKIVNEADIQKLEKDLVVSIPVSIVGVNGNLYYSQSDNIRFHKEVYIFRLFIINLSIYLGVLFMGLFLVIFFTKNGAYKT